MNTVNINTYIKKSALLSVAFLSESFADLTSLEVSLPPGMSTSLILGQSTIMVDGKNLLELSNDQPLKDKALATAIVTGKQAYEIGEFVLNKTKEAAIKQVDQQVEQHIRNIAAEAGHMARQGIHDLFFKSRRTYGEVQGSGQRVNIYSTNSELLNNLFYRVFNKSLDDMINTLPFGVSHVTGMVRTKIENMIVNGIVGHLVGFGVDTVVEQTLLKAYGFSKDQIAAALTKSQVTKKEEKLLSPSAKRFTKQIRLEKDPFEDFYHILARSNEQEASITNDIVEAFLDKKANEEDVQSITLRDVVEGYKARIIEHFNDQLNPLLTNVISAAAHKVTLEGTKSLNSKAAATLTGIGIPAIAINPVGGLMATATGVMMKVFEDDVANYAADKAADKAYEAAHALIPQAIVPVNYEIGTTRFKSLMDSLAGWDLMEYTAPTLENWLKGKANDAAEMVRNVKDKANQALDMVGNAANAMGDALDTAGDVFDLMHGYGPAIDMNKSVFLVDGEDVSQLLQDAEEGKIKDAPVMETKAPEQESYSFWGVARQFFDTIAGRENIEVKEEPTPQKKGWLSWW